MPELRNVYGEEILSRFVCKQWPESMALESPEDMETWLGANRYEIVDVERFSGPSGAFYTVFKARKP